MQQDDRWCFLGRIWDLTRYQCPAANQKKIEPEFAFLANLHAEADVFVKPIGLVAAERPKAVYPISAKEIGKVISTEVVSYVLYFVPPWLMRACKQGCRCTFDCHMMTARILHLHSPRHEHGTKT